MTTDNEIRLALRIIISNGDLSTPEKITEIIKVRQTLSAQIWVDFTEVEQRKSIASQHTNKLRPNDLRGK